MIQQRRPSNDKAVQMNLNTLSRKFEMASSHFSDLSSATIAGWAKQVRDEGESYKQTHAQSSFLSGHVRSF